MARRQLKITALTEQMDPKPVEKYDTRHVVTHAGVVVVTSKRPKKPQTIK